MMGSTREPCRKLAAMARASWGALAPMSAAKTVAVRSTPSVGKDGFWVFSAAATSGASICSARGAWGMPARGR